MNNAIVKRSVMAVAILLLLVLMKSALYAGQSTITVVDGTACMGDDKSRKQTEMAALNDAKRRAAENAATYLKSETRVKDFQVEKDLVDAYSNATIRIIEEIQQEWYKDPVTGDCFRLKVKAEIVPSDKTMEQISKEKGVIDDPGAPLNVQVWTDRKEYRQSDKIKVFIKGNKPFYARVLHKDGKGTLLQLLPNAYRTDNYFNGGVVYEIPSGNDRFELEVSPPFGEESIIVYSSLTPLGDINLQEKGGVDQVQTMANDVGVKTRGIKLQEKGAGNQQASSEFFEGGVTLRTTR
jgi:hypothetical protein